MGIVQPVLQERTAQGYMHNTSRLLLHMVTSAVKTYQSILSLPDHKDPEQDPM